MKQLCTSYTFDPATKQIDFTDLSAPIALEQVLVIFNVTDNVSLYNFADAANAGASIANNVLTLPAGVSTVGMAATDHLLIYLDIQDYKDIIPAPVIIDDTQPFRVSGQTADGMVRPVKVGPDGGMQLSDGLLVNYLIDSTSLIPGQSIDTSGYQSVVVNLAGSPGGSGVVRAYGSNDQVNWTILNAVNFSGNSSLSYPNAPNTYAVQYRYFRVGMSVAGTNKGIPVSIALRSGPAVLIPLGSGMMVQGPDGVGSPPAGSPVTVAGWDGTNVRRLMTDAAGYLEIMGTSVPGATATSRPVAAGGADTQGKARHLLTDPDGILQVNATLPQGDRATPSIVELLMLILNELRVNNVMTHELPQVLNAGQPMKAEALLSDDPNTQLIS